MTFPTISAGTRANEAIGGYANFVAYCNALAAGVDSVTTTAAGAALKANNLSDLASASSARTALGLGTAAVANVGDFIKSTVTQAGTALNPTAQTLWSYQPADTNRGPFQWIIGGAAFNGVFDPVLYFGYNVTDGGGLAKAGEASFRDVLESHYNDGTKNVFERYFEFAPADGSTPIRPLFIQMNKATNAVTNFVLRSNNVTFTDEAADSAYLSLGPNAITMLARTGADNSFALQAASGRSTSFNMYHAAGASPAFAVNTLAASQASISVNGYTNTYFFQQRGMAVNVQDNTAALTVQASATALVSQFKLGATPGDFVRYLTNGGSTVAKIDSAGLATFAGVTSTALITTPASTTASAGLNVPPGTTPTSPVSGDVWMTSGAGLLWRNGAATRTAVAIEGAQTITGAKTFSAAVTTAASATGGAGLNIPHGAAPTSPVNGDMWTTTAGLFIRINGATVGPLS